MVLTVIFFVLILLVIILVNKINTLVKKCDILQCKYSNKNDEFIYIENELKRCKWQLSIYEKIFLEKTDVKIYNKKIEVNPIYVGKRALVGDYNNCSLENTIKVLQSFGIAVDIVKTGEEIVDKIKYGYKCDIIFTNNIYESGYNGQNVLYKLRKIEGFNIPVIIHTVSKNEFQYFINECGFDGYVVKPISYKKIKPILDKFLDSH